jgi:MFS family permease
LITGFAFHVISIGESLGMENERILSFFLPITLISIPTNFVLGWLSDRTRIKYLLCGMTVAQVVTGLSFLFMPGAVGPILLIIGLGVSAGAFVSLSGVVFPRYFGRKYLGSINGFYLSSAVISSALGPIFFSRLYTVYGSYAPAFLISGALALGLLLCSPFAGNPQRRHRPGEEPSGQDDRAE